MRTLVRRSAKTRSGLQEDIRCVVAGTGADARPVSIDQVMISL